MYIRLIEHCMQASFVKGHYMCWVYRLDCIHSTHMSDEDLQHRTHVNLSSCLQGIILSSGCEKVGFLTVN